MNNRETTASYPSLLRRIYSVWFRHFRVYTRHLVSNGLPPFLEPLIFLAGIGLGLGVYVSKMDGISYIQFLASAIMAPPAMYTAAFECSFGTFIRMEYDHVYDGMLASSITVRDLLVGEILFAGTKGMFYAAAVLVIISFFGLASYPTALLGPVGGFLTGTMFASLSLSITAFVKTINHFNFYFTGLLTPMFFFSGMVFPISKLPEGVRWIAEVLPLSHSIRFIRAATLNRFSADLWYDIVYMVLFSLLFSVLAVKLLRRRLVD